MSSQKVQAEQGDVLAICTEWLTGSPSPDDVRKWLDRAKAAGEPRSTESSLLLEELRGHLMASETDPVWRELTAHGVFGVVMFSSAGNAGMMTALAAVSGATVTAAILPFLQAIATQAGHRSFEVARATTRRMIGRSAGSAPEIHHGRTKLFLEETAAGLRFNVPPRLPDSALAALATLDLEALAAPDRNGGTVTIYWDEAAEEWRRDVVAG
ncbi:hypothetical protein [Streptomyces sp. NPDC058157]|uniref:hypothetical protein n=1 Tax=Streptomyces sp. NPDC058157 TaxID=3346360 RepID=UPI0036EAF857